MMSAQQPVAAPSAFGSPAANASNGSLLGGSQSPSGFGASPAGFGSPTAGSPQAPAQAPQGQFAVGQRSAHLVGAPACKQLVYAPVKAPSHLAPFQAVKDMAYMRVCRKKNHSSRTQERVIVVSRYCLLITDLTGSVKRFMKYSEIQSVVLQKFEGNWQMLIICEAPEHDVLLRLVEDHRNSHIGSGDDEVRIMMEVYRKIASTYRGNEPKIIWKDTEGDVASLGNLKKKSGWTSPALRWKTEKKVVQTQVAARERDEIGHPIQPNQMSPATGPAQAQPGSPFAQPAQTTQPFAQPQGQKQENFPSFGSPTGANASSPSFSSPMSAGSSTPASPVFTIAEFDANQSVAFGMKRGDSTKLDSSLADDDWGPITSSASSNTSQPVFGSFQAGGAQPPAPISTTFAEGSGSPSFRPSASPTFKPPSFGSFTPAKPVNGSL